jgi:hypothetical protein
MLLEWEILDLGETTTLSLELFLMSALPLLFLMEEDFSVLFLMDGLLFLTDSASLLFQ